MAQPRSPSQDCKCFRAVKSNKHSDNNVASLGALGDTPFSI